jgi:outer membrane biosynthesis protein TonB
MRVSASVIRFLLEAAFIVAVAAATAVAHLDKLWIALAVGGAWALVTLVERTAKQGESWSFAGLRALVPRRRREATAPAASTTPEHPEPEPPTPEPEPEPEPEPAPPAPAPDAPRPEPEQPTPQLRAVAPLEPEPAREAQTGVVAFRPRTDGAPREWNVWELERIAREREGEDAARDEELAFLLLELRQFANADGQLPASFDPVVREAFGESLYSGV